MSVCCVNRKIFTVPSWGTNPERKWRGKVEASKAEREEEGRRVQHLLHRLHEMAPLQFLFPAARDGWCQSAKRLARFISYCGMSTYVGAADGVSSSVLCSSWLP
jgi:hypothetical protein